MAAQRDWKVAAKRLVRAEMQHAGVNFKVLARRLERFGVALDNTTLSNKINRGSFSAAFLLQCLAALEADELRLDRGLQHQRVSAP